ncbi:hypothetical protein CU669_15085 [Paramagnetospirillum kuznetsovii]|uniref:Ubiquitin-activating enzyme E1 FCCH domain-containing protein n=1 Tax=Paramagnetospirillum kuznetsovii TaxID=2053833 RepID=A0A364NVG8_9PROT|nr:ubiquitin-activating E1 FCCH domain-containing protein [Paramagnetospirillum kuznetsovii]RAU21078.1 hypothetical protein CU669_15085 [Paramagnetospirillum kuznetsovii]
MSRNAIQPSFAAGELAPSLYARVDLAKYHIGAKRLLNFFVHAHGGASNRPGTVFIGRVKDTANPVRLISFTFSTTQAYCLEFGNLYMRVIMNGGHVLESAKTITAASQANPCQITSAAHGFSNGDEVYVTGVVGMTALNNKRFIVAGSAANTFTLKDLDGNAINSTAYGAYTSGGTVARVYTLTTPYAGSDLALLKTTQSADTMTITHPSYAPRDLTRTGHAAWTLTSITFQPKVNSPTGATISGGAGSWHYSYVITAETDSPTEESIPSTAVTGAMAQLNQNTGVQNIVTWTAPASGNTPDRYRVYKARPSYNVDPAAGTIYGYIGQATGTSFTDTNIDPDFTQTPPQAKNPFASSNNPGVVEYFEQRRIFAASTTGPQTIWMTQPGSYYNMDTSSPSVASDAITVTIAAREVNAINWLVPMNSLIVLTASGAWKASGGSASDAMTPSNVVMKPQSYSGCSSYCKPIIINNDILYVQAKGSTVRDLAYNFYADVFTGSDMSVLSNHLFFGRTLMEWAYAEEPYKIVWAVRDDGVLLSFTYLKEQDVYAWARHNTDGNFKSVATVSEGAENAVYFVVERTIPGVNGGNPVKYVEKLHSRNFLTNGAGDVTQTWFVDCGLQYSGSATTTVTGLDHLNGKTVSILADGNVQPQQVVSGGSVSVQSASTTITVGLPYTAQLQTLNLDVQDQGGTIQGKRMKLSGVTVRLENSRGIKIGHDFSTMYEVKERTNQQYGTAIPLTTGDEFMRMGPVWDTDSSICIQQDNPLPCTILGVIPEIRVGDTPG